jgi:branched-chain amino acid transport system substrate-binding protein
MKRSAHARLGGSLACVVGVFIAASAVGSAPTASQAQEPLTVYTSFPHVGAVAVQSRDVVRGARMALDDHAGRAGGFRVTVRSLNDGSSSLGRWDPVETARNATLAAEDPLAIAYLGEFNSGATAISMPITNQAGLLHVSPSNTDDSLTRHIPGVTAQGTPDKYLVSGRRNYGRIIPTDRREAVALAERLEQLGARRAVLVDDGELYGRGIRVMLARQLVQRGIKAKQRTIRESRSGVGRVVRSLRRVRAQAMVYGGISENGAAALWRGVHRAHRRWALIGADGVTHSDFTRRLSPGSARRTYLMAPTVAPDALPSSGRAFYDLFRARFGAEPDPYAIHGYEGMALILDSIDRASNPADRRAVIEAFFATTDRASLLGRYSIDPFGDTTLASYGSYRVDRFGRIVWDRVISLPPD